MIILFHRAALTLLLISPLLGLAQGLENLTQYTLDNGLTVILNEDHTRSEVFGYMVCNAGSKDDPSDATGMAHYMEHLLFKGTEELGTTDWEKEKPHIDSIFVLYDKLGVTTDEAERKAIQLLINEQSVKANEYAIPNELDKLIKEMGGTGMNANTSGDRTVYFNTFPPNQMERWLALYSHRFQHPVFRSFQAELEVVYEEKNRGNDSFVRNLFEALMKNAFKNHPYGQQNTIGTIEDLKNPSLTKMKEFFDRWYHPNNMALILCGDFNSEEVKPMIEAAFADWQSHEVPEHGQWDEAPFQGRELVEVRMSPVKVGLIAYRTVPVGHPDYLVLEVCNNLLSNQSQSGLLNQLTTDNKLLATEGFPLPFNDHGVNAFFFVPKIVGQSLEEAEELVLGKLEMLKQGEFDDWRIAAVKRELYRTHQESMESNVSRGQQIGEVFARGDDPASLKDYTTRVNKITKDDVLRVANEYYGADYLAFYSKMGSFKGEKIAKPNYEPVVSNTNARSAFAQRLETVSEGQFNPAFIDFDEDISSKQLQEGVTLYRSENPSNDIFSLDIRFNAGKAEIPQLEYAINLMGMAYTEQHSKQALKDEMAKIGATYYFDVDDSYTYLRLSGLESDLEAVLDLMNELLVNPKLDATESETLVEYEKADRKTENADPSLVADAALEWAKYGAKSTYLDRPTMKAVKEMKANDLLQEFGKLRGYSVEVHYVGKRTMEDLANTCEEHLSFGENLKNTDVPVVRPVSLYGDNEVMFIHKKNAVQSQVHFMQNGKVLNLDEVPNVEAFNLYFGGGFSGLVLQEIREYRSLAYTAGARYGMPERSDAPVLFRGYIGTQADKTDDAISVFMELLRDMPAKDDRMETIRKFLAYGSVSSQPGFRGTIPYVIDMQRLGYTVPPAQRYLEAYNKLTFTEIQAFYESEIKNTPTVIIVVGDKKKVDVKALEKFGKVTVVKEKSLYSK